MDYGSAMQTVGDLIKHRHLSEARAVLTSILGQHPNDTKARMILQKVDEALAARGATDRPMPREFHDQATPRRTMQAIKQAISQVVDVPWRSIPDDEPLSDLGLDSLDLVEIAIALEEDFGIEIDYDTADETLSDPDTVTVRQMARVIVEM